MPDFLPFAIEGLFPWGADSVLRSWRGEAGRPVRKQFGPHCFNFPEDGSPVQGLFDHEDRHQIAHTGDGSLQLKQDGAGLHFRFLLPNDLTGQLALKLARAGALSGASVGFHAEKERGLSADRTRVEKASLFEVSLLTKPKQPAFPVTAELLRLTQIDPNKVASRGPGASLSAADGERSQGGRYPHIVEQFYSTPWALLPSKLEEVRAFIERKSAGEIQTLAESAPPQPQAAARRFDVPTTTRGTAMLSVFGVLSQRMNLFQAISGGTSTELLGAKLDQLVADPAVKAIVLAVDSPGGSVFGIAELAAKIRAAAGSKRVVAVADSMAASAALWLATQAGEFVATPGGQVGSVGVVAAHQDVSEADRKDGIRTTYIHAGKYKVEGNPNEPLGVEARAYLQEMVNKYYAMFVADVGRGRGVSAATVEARFGQGRMLLASDAQAVGLVDAVKTFEQVVRLVEEGRPLTSGSRTGGGSRAATATAGNWSDIQARAREVEREEINDRVRHVQAEERRVAAAPARRSRVTVGSSPAERNRRAAEVERESRRR